jgi:hypothetical protein
VAPAPPKEAQPWLAMVKGAEASRRGSKAVVYITLGCGRWSLFGVFDGYLVQR